MHGDYRKMFARAEQLEVQTVRFDQKDVDLLEAFEELPVLAARHQEGQHFAILLKFRLQKSTYATMLIREFCHISSSFENQELINKTAETEDVAVDDGDEPADGIKEEVIEEETG